MHMVEEARRQEAEKQRQIEREKAKQKAASMVSMEKFKDCFIADESDSSDEDENDDDDSERTMDSGAVKGEEEHTETTTALSSTAEEADRHTTTTATAAATAAAVDPAVNDTEGHAKVKNIDPPSSPVPEVKMTTDTTTAGEELMTSISTARKEENDPNSKEAIGDTETCAAREEGVRGVVEVGYGTDDEDSAEDPSECLSTTKAGVEKNCPPENEDAVHLSEKVLFFACDVLNEHVPSSSFRIRILSFRSVTFFFASLLCFTRM